MPTEIVLENLTKTFPAIGAEGRAGATVTAVDNVTLTVPPGDLFFLLGPSGCGKTTLLRMIAGFIDPTSGRIGFRTGGEGDRGVPTERDVTHLPANRRNTGMVFQSYALWPHMTVAENVAFGLRVRKVGAAERERRVAQALEAVRMGPYAARKPNQLSGGQQQRVALARALVIRPDVLLLDEPLSNLDAKLRTELRSEIRRICKESGITGVYVTHDQKEALSMADTVAIVSQGRVVQIGAPAVLYRRPATAFVAEFLGETNFIRGTVVSRDADALSVQTPAGRLVSRQVSLDLAGDAAEVLLSVRPEAFRVGAADGINTLFGRVVDSLYLGETAQLTAELPGHVRVKVAQLNPNWIAGEASARGGADAISLAVSPEDVVALPLS